MSLNIFNKVQNQVAQLWTRPLNSDWGTNQAMQETKNQEWWGSELVASNPAGQQNLKSFPTEPVTPISPFEFLSVGKFGGSIANGYRELMPDGTWTNPPFDQ